jgi:hypothetical protein
MNRKLFVLSHTKLSDYADKIYDVCHSAHKYFPLYILARLLYAKKNYQKSWKKYNGIADIKYCSSALYTLIYVELSEYRYKKVKFLY